MLSSICLHQNSSNFLKYWFASKKPCHTVTLHTLIPHIHPSPLTSHTSHLTHSPLTPHTLTPHTFTPHSLTPHPSHLTLTPHTLTPHPSHPLTSHTSHTHPSPLTHSPLTHSHPCVSPSSRDLCTSDLTCSTLRSMPCA